MTTYEVGTPDGILHTIEAITHVRDSNGLTLLVDGGKAVAMFPVFSWMRLASSVVEPGTGTTEVISTEAGETTTSGEVAAPAASGE
ncbi:hypothetical protein NJI34_00260 [Pseudomonas sp. S 311-6]|uniref:hypothetical protein n=1 Tax=Pseudomonas TaxID=286 RepID=UPI0020970978|nr:MULTISPECIES: hypothetical protein [Pseudomonas]MCO7563559.1 hypothetical protein [Pseudomonas mosselii]MCO7616246.1 hypothetical protein [Pseudomonas guariconensis]MCO7635215.1 hypothetical protein [Pseudomonas sp. S 311-6]